MRLIPAVSLIFVAYLMTIGVISSDKPFDCSNFRCWDGIVVGETTLPQAQRLLEHFHDRQNRYSYTSNITGWFFIDWDQSDNPPLHGSVGSSDNVLVTRMRITFGSRYLRVDELMSITGVEPVVYVRIGAKCNIMLIFNGDREIVAELDPQETSIGVQPHLPIRTLTILMPQEPLYINFPDIPTLEWQGYTNYCERFNDQSS